MTDTPYNLKCLRCGYSWLRRILGTEPKQCPKCKSPYWNRVRRAETVKV